jgi:hypothetical protein
MNLNLKFGIKSLGTARDTNKDIEDFGTVPQFRVHPTVKKVPTKIQFNGEAEALMLAPEEVSCTYDVDTKKYYLVTGRQTGIDSPTYRTPKEAGFYFYNKQLAEKLRKTYAEADNNEMLTFNLSIASKEDDYTVYAMNFIESAEFQSENIVLGQAAGMALTTGNVSTLIGTTTTSEDPTLTNSSEGELTTNTAEALVEVE